VSYTDSSTVTPTTPTDPWATDNPPEPWAAEPEATTDETPAEPTPRKRGRPRGSGDSRPRKPATRKASTTRRRTTRPAGDRRTAERALSVVGLADDELDLLRAVVAAEGSDLADVVLASLEREAAAARGLDLVIVVAQAEPLAAGAKAVEASTAPGGLGVAWTALGALAPGLGEVPAGMLDAGLSFATVAQSLSGEALGRAKTVRDVLTADG